MNERGCNGGSIGEVNGMSDMAELVNVVVAGTGKGMCLEKREGGVKDEAELLF